MGKETPIVLGLVTEGNYMACENKRDYSVNDRIVQKVHERSQNRPKINKRGPNWTQSEETVADENTRDFPLTTTSLQPTKLNKRGTNGP